MALRLSLLTAIVFLAAAAGGCQGVSQHPMDGAQNLAHGPAVANPLFVPVADPELVSAQVLEAVGLYFRIHREERVRRVGDVMLEGRIETFPTDGSTILEPWRRDSTHGFEKWHATLQSIRRRAVARVVPEQGGFLIDLAVHKELEDLSAPEHATVDQTTFRDDGALVRTEEDRRGIDNVTLGWIPLGRDVSLEQRILADVRARLIR